MKNIVSTLFLLFLLLTVYSQIQSDIILDYPIQENTSIRARNSITLKPDFYVPIGIEFSASIASTKYTTTPSTSQNYIHTIVPQIPMTTINFSGEKDIYEVSENIQYFDGVGRPVQSIQMHGSPGMNDIIMQSFYDIYGREKYKYLPITKTTNNGGFEEVSTSEIEGYYTNGHASHPVGVVADDYPFAETEFDNSPLNRIEKQGEYGSAWQLDGAYIEYSLNTNIANEVFSLTGVDGAVLVDSEKHHAPGTLLKKGVKNENGVWSYEYSNKQGLVILKKTVTSMGDYDTYYVYDDFGLLRFVLPPLFSENITTSSTSFNFSNTSLTELCYYYQYDKRKRMVFKLIPGAEGIYMVYDKRDRLILTQDGNMRANNDWLFTKYDALDRPVMTGVYHNETIFGFEAMQEHIDNSINGTTIKYFESYPSTGSISYKDSYYGYDNESFPILTGNEIIYTVNFYDNYNYLYSSMPVDNYFDDVISTQVKGQLTGSIAFVLDGNNSDFVFTSNYYNEDERLVLTSSTREIENSSPGFYIGNHLKYDFAGNIIETYKSTWAGVGNWSNSYTEHIWNEYDHEGRLVKVTHQSGTDSPVILSEVAYNELGEMIQKKQYGGMQSLDYEYNIRGWLTKINDPSNLGNDLFGMELQYNENSGIGTLNSQTQFNGNISAMVWNSTSDEQNNKLKRAYGFSYDELNRISDADYGEGSSVQDVDYYNVYGITYDLNGNIKTLNRYGSNEVIDELIYTYENNNNSNQLTSVNENGTTYAQTHGGFLNLNSAAVNEYEYDANGNLIRDDNKGITNIEYNYLNLPSKIQYSSDNIEYIYDANGTKIEQKEQISGIVNKTTYLDNLEYDKDDNLIYSYHPEGRLRISDSNGEYDFYIKDHLGSVRSVYTKDNDGNIDELQANNYYPFGMRFKQAPVINKQDNYVLYNGKEQQELVGWYDYGWRMYDASLGRWHCMDRLSEDYFDLSPYNYVANNPMINVDPNGEFIGTVIGALAGGTIAAFRGGSWKDIMKHAASGAIAGAMVDLTIATGGAAGAVIAASALGGMAGEVALQGMYGREFDAGAVLTAGAVGGAFGMLAGAAPGIGRAISRALGKGPKTSFNVGRPTWQASENAVLTENPEFNPQVSFKNGNQVRTGTKGSVRPEGYKPGQSIEVKNYTVTTSNGRGDLVRNVVKQVRQRQSNLPRGTAQEVVVDVRGQNVTQQQMNQIRNRITTQTGSSNVTVRFKTD